MNVVEAWNEISWAEAIPFLLVLAFVYWGKLKLDTRVGLGKKKRNELKKVIVEALREAEWQG